MESTTYHVSKRFLNISINRILLISLFIFLNVFSSTVSYVGAVLSICEVIVIGLLLLKGDIINSFIILLICISGSLEMSSFVYLNGDGHTLYSIYNLPVLSIFGFYFITFLIFIMSYQKYAHRCHESLRDNRGIRKFLKDLPLLFITGLFTGLIAILVNDNGINAYSWSSTALITNSLRILSMMCFIATGVYLLSDSRNYSRVESTIVEILFSFIVVSSITVILGWHGYYGRITNIMLMPLASSLCPMLFVIPAFYKVKRPILYYVSAGAFTVESMFLNSLMGSKFYMIPLFSLLIYVVVTMRRGRFKSLILIGIGFLLVLVNSGSILNLITGTEYGQWKYNQFINVFNFSGGGLVNWYNNVDASPRFRIDEFVNIALEYVHKPFYALFGKGNAGSIIHRWGTTDWNRGNGTFADYQISSGIFLSMHESINVLFIRHGLVGLFFFLSTVISAIKRVLKSPWAIGGIMWIFFYWGIYISWWIGAIMLVMSMMTFNYSDEEIID